MAVLKLLQKIPVVMERERVGNHSTACPQPVGPHFRFSEENGLIDSLREQPLNRVKLFRQITQLGFKLVSVSSSGRGGERDRHIKPSTTDRWIFTRAIK